MMKHLAKLKKLIYGRVYQNISELNEENVQLKERLEILENDIINANHNIDELKRKIDGLTQDHNDLAKEYYKSATEKAMGIRSMTGL